jgi:chemotaxis protein CheX
MQTNAEVTDFEPVVHQIVEHVFQTMMAMDVHALDTPLPSSGELITAAISLAGSWKGAVLVECGLSEAFLFTSRMIGIDAPTSLNDDVRDALGELANMVGGNLKSVLPGGVTLSLPTVVWGVDYTMQICRAGRSRRWTFQCPEATFAVELIEVAD